LKRGEISARWHRTARAVGISIVVASGGRRSSAAVACVYDLDIVDYCSRHFF
jgi:hypothetical protein